MTELPASGIAALTQRALTAGRAAFGHEWNPDRQAIAPGRIELLGNHLDYNGGPVLAAAIDRYIVVLASAANRQGREIEAVAADVPGEHAVLDPATLVGWRNDLSPPRPLDYLRGLIATLVERSPGPLRAPAYIAFAGDVPIGFGLSSSAALCVGLALALTTHSPTPEEIVLIAQEAEHRAGTPCGTMDQSTSISGGVIRFDASTLKVERLSPALGDFVFAVVDSGVERSLGTSSYPVRVRESHEALDLARHHLGAEIPYLAAITNDQLGNIESSSPEFLREPLLRRLRHVVSETSRVHAGANAIAAEDWALFGRLMTTSGHSSATDYEISHPRVEELVADILHVDGVLGARMMGGGEGGTALTLLHRDSVPRLDATLRRQYFQRHDMTNRADLIHVCAFADGARIERV